jgi:hypothetical protein
MPGATCASACRAAIARKPPLPSDGTSVAAAAMTDATRTALALVEHAQMQAAKAVERQRRDSDRMGDCAFD